MQHKVQTCSQFCKIKHSEGKEIASNNLPEKSEAVGYRRSICRSEFPGIPKVAVHKPSFGVKNLK
jgi:hypothetical protein